MYLTIIAVMRGEEKGYYLLNVFIHCPDFIFFHSNRRELNCVSFDFPQNVFGQRKEFNTHQEHII